MLHPTSTITITAGTRCVTLINVFTVERGHQDELVDALDRATAEVFTGVSGFISANVHASLDGTRVVNYAQWASEEAYAAAMARPEVRRHIADAAARATSYDPTLAQVRAIHHADQE